MNQIMPLFVFFRRREVEIEIGYTLAGLLIVDLPQGKKPKLRDERMITEIIQRICAQSKHLPDDAEIYGWPSVPKPPNADEITDNDELMSAWAETRLKIEVRVGAGEDDCIRIGSTDLRRLFPH
jgi:hypothetical protein